MKKTENILEPKSKDKINQEIREMDVIDFLNRVPENVKLKNFKISIKKRIAYFLHYDLYYKKRYKIIWISIGCLFIILAPFRIIFIDNPILHSKFVNIVYHSSMYFLWVGWVFPLISNILQNKCNKRLHK